MTSFAAFSVVAASLKALRLQNLGSDWSVFIALSSNDMAHLVTNLPSSLSATELSVCFKAHVPIDSDLSSVENRAGKRVDCYLRFIPCGELNEAKTARLQRLFVKPHNQVDDLATLRKKFEQLGLNRVER